MKNTMHWIRKKFFSKVNTFRSEKANLFILLNTKSFYLCKTKIL